MNVTLPEKLQFLFEPYRFKIMLGGRGGGKTWSAARSLLLLGAQKKLRVLCTREIQNSIAESVHFALSDQIEKMGLSAFYTVQKNSIFGKNGTEFIFAGLKQNILSLKSYEGVDVCWVEEAQNVSNRSWEILIPTILRRDAPYGPVGQGSEIWVTFNPDLETDPTYKRFVVHTPPTAKVVKINYYDNEFCPEGLLAEAKQSYDTDRENYYHVWEGECKTRVEGAIYEKEMGDLERENRITLVPYERSRPVNTYWDIGDRFTEVWFIQTVGFGFRVIDFEGWEHISTADCIRELQNKPYVYGYDYLPWDAKSPNRGGSGKSFEEQIRSLGRKAVTVGRTSREAGISAVRSILPQCWFDAEKCADGLNSLKRYRWGADGNGGLIKATPFHDEHSHPADAFRVFATAARTPMMDSEMALPVSRTDARNNFMRMLQKSGTRSWMG